MVGVMQDTTHTHTPFSFLPLFVSFSFLLPISLGLLYHQKHLNHLFLEAIQEKRVGLFAKRVGNRL